MKVIATKKSAGKGQGELNDVKARKNVVETCCTT
jgi:hypothetical protein